MHSENDPQTEKFIFIVIKLTVLNCVAAIITWIAFIVMVNLFGVNGWGHAIDSCTSSICLLFFYKQYKITNFVI